MAKNKHGVTIPEHIVIGICYIAIGILFCIFKGSIVSKIMTVVAILVILKGVLNLINHYITSGVLLILAGIMMIVFDFTVLDIATIVFGILLVISGLVDLLNGAYKRLFNLVLSLLTIAGGLLFILNTGLAIDTIFIITGTLFIINGIMSLFKKKFR